MRVLGIESSCDETAAAVVEDGRRILSSVVASQIEVHRPYGGVVPELASRMHVEAIGPVVTQALSEAGLSKEGIDAVAVTQGPGLVGCLLVGFCFAKAFAFARVLPWVGVDHLAGHLHSVLLTDARPPFPLVALLASGGHTGLYYLPEVGSHELMGQTRDDAAGEAYDKVAKMLGLGYPGGAVIDRLAAQGDPASIFFTRPYLDKEGFEFSFSGLKTAVQRHLQKYPQDAHTRTADLAAGFQAAVVEVLTHKLIAAAQFKQVRQVVLVGGVAANAGLRTFLTVAAAAKGINVWAPPLSLCGDNAAMIAAAGFHLIQAGHTTPLDADVYSRNPRSGSIPTL
ncbi:MAG: tRNA (adenosine(37)-N6)-threonylcarbamoyltransferase complex transferase subunit TsaD [Desulfobacteraceae bacterium]|nr:tRNA (adenosine(37)-N6)-threonylcarbamoyltransferase complex transferase subunit TsaD [Desulfobacteraceae bacterium]